MNGVSIRIPFPTKITVNSYWFGPEQHQNREFKRLCVVDLSLSQCPENVYHNLGIRQNQLLYTALNLIIYVTFLASVLFLFLFIRYFILITQFYSTFKN